MSGRSRLILAMVIALAPASAIAAGGAFVVDDSEVDAAGKCTAQFWSSAASNHDFVGVAYPTCVFDVGTPIEFGSLLQRSRSGDMWSTSGTLTLKKNFISTDNHPFGLGIEGGGTRDLISGANTGGYMFVPVTIPVVPDIFKINVNGGWLYDNVAKISYATWGAGFEWVLDDPKTKKWTLIGEVFGQAGALPAVAPGDPPSPNSITDPRAQIGIRFAPSEKFDIDLIGGHNVTGENAYWVTLGLNVHLDLGH